MEQMFRRGYLLTMKLRRDHWRRSILHTDEESNNVKTFGRLYCTSQARWYGPDDENTSHDLSRSISLSKRCQLLLNYEIEWLTVNKRANDQTNSKGSAEGDDV